MNKNFTDLDFTDSAYLLTNVRLAKPAVFKKLACSVDELRKIAIERDDADFSDQTDDEVITGYYRMQLFLYAEILFDAELLSYKDNQLVFDKNNAIEHEQPYSWVWDNTTYPDPIPTDGTIEINIPSEWFAVIPAGAMTVLFMLDDAEHAKHRDQLIWEYLLNTLPITM